MPDANLVDHGKRSRDEQFERIVDELSDRERLWYSRIVNAGVKGITLDQLSVNHGVAQNTFSGRITSLKERGLVRHTKERRKTRSGGTAAVIVATCFLGNDQPALPMQSNTDPVRQKPASDQPNVAPVDESAVPGDLTRDTIPDDQNGEPMRNGERYVIDRMLYFCFEDADGDLFVQRCTSNGNPVANSAAVRVLEMRDGDFTVYRVTK